MKHINTQKKIPTNRKGMGTVEIVIIIAILVSLALVFREGLTNYAENIMSFVFNDGQVIGSLR
ncbi:MAG TPA: hypothetical protein GXZ67_08130 [Clostridiaceae bacterium]|jgi:hypothetical protein|nr:hypothetical protein [Clostridiaceae bacterium]